MGVHRPPADVPCARFSSWSTHFHLESDGLFVYTAYNWLWCNELDKGSKEGQSRGWRNEDPEPRVGGRGVRPKAEKIIVTSPILMAEVFVDAPKGTSDGSPRVQGVFEWL